MADSTQSVTTDGMLKAASLFTDAAGRIQGYLNNVRESVDNLVATWSGASGQGFYLAMQDWSADCNVILKELNDMAGVMQGDAVDHQQVENDAQNYTRQISQNNQGLTGLGYRTTDNQSLAGSPIATATTVAGVPRLPLDGMTLATPSIRG